jgi:hypothetical protein
MFRRVVLLLLLPTVLLTQWVGVGHSHDGFQPAGHGQIPHVHLCIFSSSHHHHDEAKHHHHDYDANPGSPDRVESLGQPALLEDHDDDAVYLPTSVVLSFQGQSSQKRSAALPDSEAVGAMVNGPLGASHLFLPLAHPPPLFCHRPHCPVYLQTCTLLI